MGGSTKKPSKASKHGGLRQRMASKRFRTLVLPLVAIVVVFGAFLLARAALNGTQHDGDSPAAKAAYQKQLKDQVDTAQGSPRDGRDPSTQQQTSLRDAASKPSGTGTRTDTPASGVTGTVGDTHVTSSDIYGDASKTGINSAGCYIDYGVQGQECLPAHAAVNGVLTCDGVREHFPQGIKVTGTDRFHLDKNGDKIACNAGD